MSNRTRERLSAWVAMLIAPILSFIFFFLSGGIEEGLTGALAGIFFVPALMVIVDIFERNRPLHHLKMIAASMF